MQKYGLPLLPNLYEAVSAMACQDAQAREVEIDINLRSAGFGIWQA